VVLWATLVYLRQIPGFPDRWLLLLGVPFTTLCMLSLCWLTCYSQTLEITRGRLMVLSCFCGLRIRRQCIPLDDIASIEAGPVALSRSPYWEFDDSFFGWRSGARTAVCGVAIRRLSGATLVVAKHAESGDAVELAALLEQRWMCARSMLDGS
jgi:hypothetical protein